jgi:hypothetical protein
MNSQKLEAVWQTRLQNAAQRSVTVESWCKDNGVSVNEYYYWQRRLRYLGSAVADVRTVSKPKSPASKNWVSLEVHEEERSGIPACLTVRISGAEIEIRPGFDAALLRSVVRSLAVEPC